MGSKEGRSRGMVGEGSHGDVHRQRCSDVGDRDRETTHEERVARGG